MIKVGDTVYARHHYGLPAKVVVHAGDTFTISYGKAMSLMTTNVVLVRIGTPCCACACDVTIEDEPSEVDGHDVWLCNRCRT